MFATYVRTSVMACAMGVGLSACAAPPPILWKSDHSYLAYAMARVQAPEIGNRCVRIVPKEGSEVITVKNDNYPWDRYTLLKYAPSAVLALTVREINRGWKLETDGRNRHCRVVSVSIQEVAHGIARGGLGSSQPYVCTKLHFMSEFSESNVKTYDGDYTGVAGGYAVWMSDRSDQRMIVDYNRTAYLALLRAFSNGIRALTGQPPLSKRAWPVCLFKRQNA